MTNISRAARTHLRNLLLCTAVIFGLAACGGGDGSGSSSSAAAANQTGSLVAPNTGVINRFPGTPSTASTSPGTAGSTPGTNSGTTTTATSGSGTVASNNKSTTPAKSSTGSATLDWTPPTDNSDGSVLSNLAGYTVYYGTSPTNLTQSVKIANPGLTAYTVTNLASGTWYFAVTAYSSAGVESGRTATISTTI